MRLVVQLMLKLNLRHTSIKTSNNGVIILKYSNSRMNCCAISTFFNLVVNICVLTTSFVYSQNCNLTFTGYVFDVDDNTPLEAAVNALPGVEVVRSASKPGLSMVQVVFRDASQLKNSRQLVSERLQ